VTFGSFYQPSRHAGGDYFDLFDLGGERIGIMVADVSGHGAPSAIVMAMMRTAVHLFPGVADDPPAMLHHLNRHFRYLWDTAMFATAVYGVLDIGRRTLRVSCAGHPPPLLVRHGNVTPLAVDPVLALFWDELGKVSCRVHDLIAGDRVVFFTDGIPDRQAPDESMFEEERLVAALAGLGSGAPSTIVEGVMAALDRFAAGHEPEDDQTLLVVGID
jgi:sigma-B regulation protein RsbU (phosphoserine phosphatase)